ncbi:MAG: peptidylprolyl isomerase [Planctomycetes bacterium]|nr:peptidylprolyl isomerase [Planctomycetota bacterium]
MIARLAYFLAVLLGATVVGAPEATPQSVGRTVLVEIETSEGEITAEIYIERAPVTAGNFLAYVDDLLFDRGSFFRSVRMDNQPDDSIRIEVIQGGSNPDRRSERFPAIALERTSVTGLRHVDGAVSMARAGPDTARSEFFICIGDQPELDFGGRRHTDSQGFAAFGWVVSGMEVVRKIHSQAAVGQRLASPVLITGARRILR